MKIPSNNYEVLRKVTKRLCREVRTLCLNNTITTGLRKIANIELPILESLTLLKDKELIVSCLNDYNCASKILKMSSEVTRLALNGKYIYDIPISVLKEIMKLIKNRK